MAKLGRVLLKISQKTRIHILELEAQFFCSVENDQLQALHRTFDIPSSIAHYSFLERPAPGKPVPRRHRVPVGLLAGPELAGPVPEVRGHVERVHGGGHAKGVVARVLQASPDDLQVLLAFEST